MRAASGPSSCCRAWRSARPTRSPRTPTCWCSPCPTMRLPPLSPVSRPPAPCAAERWSSTRVARTASRCLAPLTDGRRAAARAASGHDLHRHRRRPASARRRGVGCDERRGAATGRRGARHRDGRRAGRGSPKRCARCTTQGLAFGAEQPRDARDRRPPSCLRAAGVEQPQRMLGPLLGAALDNSLRSGDRALTGPVARGDAGTVATHLRDARRRMRRKPCDAYVAMSRLTAVRALAAGILDVDAGRRIARRPCDAGTVVTGRRRAHPRGARRGAGRAAGPVAVVMTMGALHDGHARLIDVAREHGDSVVVDDLRQPDAVRRRRGPGPLPAHARCRPRGLRRALVSTVVFAPAVEEMYPADEADPRSCWPETLGERLEGAHRPGHFDGVLTVVVAAARPHPAGRRRLRREGRAAARADPADGRRLSSARRDRRRADGPGARRLGDVQPQPLPRARPSARSRSRSPGRWSWRGSTPTKGAAAVLAAAQAVLAAAAWNRRRLRRTGRRRTPGPNPVARTRFAKAFW